MTQEETYRMARGTPAEKNAQFARNRAASALASYQSVTGEHQFPEDRDNMMQAGALKWIKKYGG